MAKIINMLMIFLLLFSLSTSIKNKTILNITKRLNISDIKQKIKNYEKEYIDLYIKSSKKEEMFCDKIRNNINLLQEIKNKIVVIESDFNKAFLNDTEIKEFLVTRGDIYFGMRNIEIIVKNLQKKQKSCINKEKEFENIKKEINEKTCKNTENIIEKINNFLKINNDL